MESEDSIEKKSEVSVGGFQVESESEEEVNLEMQLESKENW